MWWKELTPKQQRSIKTVKEGARGNTWSSNPGSKMGLESRQRPAQRKRMMVLVEFIDNREARGPLQEVMRWGKRGKKNTVSTKTQSARLFCPLSFPTHSKLLRWGRPYLRSLLHRVFADTQVHRCRCMCQWGSCIPSVFLHNHVYPLHTHPHLERMYSHKFIRGAALISCLLNTKWCSVTNFHWHYCSINLLPFALLGSGLLRWEGVF